MSKQNKIAFQGTLGAHSDMACRKVYPYLNTMPCPLFDDVFEAVEEDKAKYGMIPIENSHAGRVAEIHNILPHTDLHIVGEYFHPVHHTLLAPKGATMESIKEVHSHPQALMQCAKNIRKMGVKPVNHLDTAMAAEDIAKWNDTTKAALASDLAGELYGLQPLKQNMEDEDTNTTIFIILSKEPVDPEEDKPILTTVVFTVKNIPSALYKALGGFATNGVNILKLESYLPPRPSANAKFFITFEGNPMQQNVKFALEELGFYCKRIKILGVYNGDPMRFKK